MRRIWVLAALLAVVLPVVLPTGAGADTARTVIDRVDLEPSLLTGQRLSIHLSAMNREGGVVELDRNAIKAMTSSELKAPFALGRYGATKSITAIAILVQATVEFTDALPVIASALDANVLASLNEHTQVAVMTYGEAVGAGRFVSAKSARTKMSGLSSDGTAGDPMLLDSIERAMVMLKKFKTNPANQPVRKILIIVGDGRDSSGEPEKPKKKPVPQPAPVAPPKGAAPPKGPGPGSGSAAPAPPLEKPVFVARETADRERVKLLGDRAAKDSVRIHVFAHAPTKQRRPLLALGELARRSLGTFRFVELRESWPAAMRQLRDEINQQYVVTYFLPNEPDIAGKRVKIVTTGRIESTSNEARIPARGCGGEACEGYCANETCVVPQAPSSRGFFGWIFLIAGLAVLAIVLLSLVGYVISRIQARKILLPPGAQLPPGSVPPKSIAPGKLPRPVTAPPPPPGSIPAPAQPKAPVTSGPRFLVLTGPRTGETFALKHGFMIGKTEGCDIHIEDGYTSGYHAQVQMDQFGNCRVFDLGSTNGTFANGVRITEYALDHGASIRVGSTEIRFLSQ